MTIFEFAINMENEGEKYYRELAEKTKYKGIKDILNMLADEEVKHSKIFTKMAGGTPVSKIEKSEIFKNVKTIFTKMKEKGETFNFGENETDYYKKAREMEIKSYQFYLDKSQEVATGEKEILLKIAEEEKRHIELMENLAEFYAAPTSWLENAEFTQMSDY